jgi:hypothetical protein
MSIDVTIIGTTQTEAADAFRRLAAYEQYPEQARTVRSVEIAERDGVSYSTWTVEFRGGLLRWTEEDEIDVDAGLLRFRQVEGDLELFVGSWRVQQDGTQTLLTFKAELDLGIPSLAPLIDPVARRALQDNIKAILIGLFPDVRMDPDATAVGADAAA